MNKTNSGILVIERELDQRDLFRLQEIENAEWRESLEYVLRQQGPDRVRQILGQLHSSERVHCEQSSTQLQQRYIT